MSSNPTLETLEQRIIILEEELAKAGREKEDLREKAEMFENIINGVSMLITYMDTEERYVFVNRAYAQWYGVNPEQLIGKRVADILKPDVYVRASHNIKKVLSGQPVSYENKVIDKDRRERFVRVNYEPHFIGGQVKGFYTSIVDITEIRNTEKALRESENRYHDLVKYAPAGIFEIDVDTNCFVSVNDVICEYLGFTRNELLQINIFDLLTEESQKLMIQRRDKLVAGEQISNKAEYSIKTKSGEPIWILQHSRYIYNEGKVKGVTGIIHDITEKKQSEEALRTSEERFKSIVSTSQEWIWAIDNKGRHTFSNPACEKILGYLPEEIVGYELEHLIHEEDLPLVRELLSRSARQKKGWSNFVIRWKHRNGTFRYLESNAVPIFDSTGNLKGFQGSDRDITERKRAEEYQKSIQERLKRAEKMEVLGRMAGKVAHDLNNVLGAMTGYSELLLMDLPEGQQARTYAEKIMQSTQRAAAIIQDLLTLARRGVMAAEVINLNTVIAGFLKSPVFEMMKEHHPRVSFRTDCEEKLLNIKVSPVHLEKMLMNLLSNAADAIPNTGEVSIRTQNRYLEREVNGYDEVREGDYVVLTVSDTGTGIPAENLDKIFEPFYTNKSMGRSGTGLGLSIVWGTVKDHDGHIDVQSKVGEGTTFTLYFPMTREGMTLPQQKVPMEQFLGKGEFVLVIDDIAEQRDVASGLLAQLGYKVHAISGGEEAVDYLRGHRADILVLDMIMAPGIDGLETYQRILQINPKQKAILVSGFSETDRVREAQRLGAGTYVKKPYAMETIGMAIRNELNR